MIGAFLSKSNKWCLKIDRVCCFKSQTFSFLGKRSDVPRVVGTQGASQPLPCSMGAPTPAVRDLNVIILFGDVHLFYSRRILAFADKVVRRVCANKWNTSRSLVFEASDASAGQLGWLGSDFLDNFNIFDLSQNRWEINSQYGWVTSGYNCYYYCSDLIARDDYVISWVWFDDEEPSLVSSDGVPVMEQRLRSTGTNGP